MGKFLKCNNKLYYFLMYVCIFVALADIAAKLDCRLQSSCQDILHSKKVLFLIVLLNITDCLLVLAGLILDIHYIKGKPTQQTA